MEDQDRYLLGMFADTRFRSGEELAASIGITRAAVAKRLNRLERELPGFHLRRVRGKGYAITNPCELIPEAESWPSDLQHLLHPIVTLLKTGSTNQDARAALQTNAGPLICVAECQTSGRGRKGREWISPFAHNLYFSIGVEFPAGFGRLAPLSPVIAIAIAEILEAGGLSVQLKWPNDVYVAGKKIAGILLEAQGEGDGPLHVVIGVGLNFSASSAMMRERIDQPWTSLAEQLGRHGTGSRHELLWRLVRNIHARYESFVDHGFAPHRQAWMERDMYLGRKIGLRHAAGRTETGIHQGVDEQGAILLAVPGQGIQARNGGEISLRPAT